MRQSKAKEFTIIAKMTDNCVIVKLKLAELMWIEIFDNGLVAFSIPTLLFND
jgi:hypothetical protein